jgi:16S rRNA U516 pseudouridylate synthase RsuA-like enzyme
MMRKNPFVVIYEDERTAAVNKSPGLSVGGDRWDESKERLDRLLSAFLGVQKLYTVHRIDRDTSGIVVFAKDAETHKILSGVFESRNVQKRYIAVVGNTKPVFLSAIKRGWRGDPFEEKPLLARLGLHGAELCIPAYKRSGAGVDDEKGLAFKAPLARDMAALINQMEKASGGVFGV